MSQNSRDAREAVYNLKDAAKALDKAAKNWKHHADWLHPRETSKSEREEVDAVRAEFDKLSSAVDELQKRIEQWASLR
jgi:ubiquinone biosynthesis protein UbiJ